MSICQSQDVLPAIPVTDASICRHDIQEQLRVMKGPIQWSIYITNRCNMHCDHCFNRSGILQRNELSDQEVRRIICQIVEQKPFGVCICGGEPLLREQLVYECINILKTAGVLVNIVSNGYLINFKRAYSLANSGVEIVQISVDGATDSSHDRLRNMKGAHQKALDAIKNLIKVGIKVAVAFTPTRYNITEFKKLCGLLYNYGVQHIRVQPIMPIGNLLDKNSEILPTEAQYRFLVSMIQEFQVNNKYPGLQIIWGDPVDHLVRFPTEYPSPLYFGEITAEGFLGISSYLGLFFGTLHRHTIDEYWEAGFKNAWEMDITKNMASQVRCINDLGKTQPHVYYDKPIIIDLIDDTPEKIKEITKKFIESQSAS